MRLLIGVLVCLVPAVAEAAECKDIQARYKAKLDAARYESPSFRKVTFGYLQSLEQTFAACFKAGDGAKLVTARQQLQKANPPAKRRPGDEPEPTRSQPAKRRVELSSGGDGGAGSWSGRRRNIGPASAAMLSLAIPGAGQAVNNQGVAAWLFFVGATGCYAVGGALISTAFDAKTAQWDNGQLTGALVVMILGGVIHVSGVVHAAITARR